ncbi:XdhC family protein [Hansschlegelia sp.]|uniref:XdhC family protein n=1 Tax=Hansschlegelia sp. TaxID=2041892 RepID=UPI002C48C661|nr:XdhC family protein [Hansschlegelia sp.]HVI28349.1 XdhC family protein [Hansschlegelia sp.]
MRLDLLSALNAARAARRPAVVATALDTDEQRLVLDPAGDPLEEAITRALTSARSGVVEDAAGRAVFLNVHVPPPRLVLTGAVHIAQTLAPLAASLGYEVAIVDPRTAFATPERFPAVELRAEWPETALPDLGLDAFTAFAALSHDPKIDDPGLAEALGRGCFYVGALGSRRTHAARLERLKAQGVTPAALERIRAPIGLAIGASSPAEIAVSIMAEITAVLRRAELGR